MSRQYRAHFSCFFLAPLIKLSSWQLVGSVFESIFLFICQVMKRVLIYIPFCKRDYFQQSLWMFCNNRRLHNSNTSLLFSCARKNISVNLSTAIFPTDPSRFTLQTSLCDCCHSRYSVVSYSFLWDMHALQNLLFIMMSTTFLVNQSISEITPKRDENKQYHLPDQLFS